MRKSAQKLIWLFVAAAVFCFTATSAFAWHQSYYHGPVYSPPPYGYHQRQQDLRQRQQERMDRWREQEYQQENLRQQREQNLHLENLNRGRLFPRWK